MGVQVSSQLGGAPRFRKLPEAPDPIEAHTDRVGVEMGQGASPRSVRGDRGQSWQENSYSVLGPLLLLEACYQRQDRPMFMDSYQRTLKMLETDV